MAKEAVSKRRALGRGIDALIRDELAREDSPRIVRLSPSDIVPNRYQPRQEMDEETRRQMEEYLASLLLSGATAEAR